MSNTPGTPHSVAHGLMEQGWYWADADRATVSKALMDQPDGSFIVRNASTPGDYTLSVKFAGHVKLLRIVVNDGKCGFHSDNLQHDSLVILIEFYRNISLNVFNDALDVCLLHPVTTRRNSQNGKPFYRRGHLQQRTIVAAKNDVDWRERLELERLRAINLTFERAAKLYDSVHQEMEKAESHYHVLSQSVKDNERKLGKLKELLTVEQVVVKEVDDARSASDMLKSVFHQNKKFVEESIRRVAVELATSSEKKYALEKIIAEISAKKTTAKSRLCKFMAIRNTHYEKMDTALASRMAAIFDSSLEMVNIEPLKVTQLLVDMELKWYPEQWLMCGTSKENAANALIHARYRIAQLDKELNVKREPMDGIFLVRGSASHSDKLVLSVLHGERVSHCLIEQNDEGWGFEHSNVYMPTIADFVRYYSVYSLETHAEAIKTTLRMPAFLEIDESKKSAVLKNGPGQVFSPLPISTKYMEKAMLTDDPFKEPKGGFGVEMGGASSSSTLEKPDSLPLRSMTVRDTIPE